eukprot:CAMPEP_0197081466 /NCGR_PEP_ID=MMETSP1384-20130603/214649_1 /TAXON_ID=29189 /ORGANISM="Ammonia sp." /LENGTH=141 /DNA_ID=CAMNT_0042520361 /DNA_START=1344 /DNA_END=1769 /DNA_ORIENTATION=-
MADMVRVQELDALQALQEAQLDHLEPVVQRQLVERDERVCLDHELEERAAAVVHNQEVVAFRLEGAVVANDGGRAIGQRVQIVEDADFGQDVLLDRVSPAVHHHHFVFVEQFRCGFGHKLAAGLHMNNSPDFALQSLCELL